MLFSLARRCSNDCRRFSSSCCERRIRASMAAPTVRGVVVLSELIVMAVDSVHSSVHWRAAILLRFASIALALKARMYSAWVAAKHLRMALRKVLRAPLCVPEDRV